MSLAVLGFIHIVERRRAIDLVITSARNLAGLEMGRERRGDEQHRAVEHRGVDELATTGIAACDQSGEHANRGMHPAAGIVGKQIQWNRRRLILAAHQ